MTFFTKNDTLSNTDIPVIDETHLELEYGSNENKKIIWNEMLNSEWTGEYWLGFDEDVLLFKAQNHWNLEITKDCSQHLTNFIKENPQKEWAFIVDSRNFKTNTNDSFEFWDKAIRTWKEQGLKHIVRVGSVTSEEYLKYLKAFDDYFETIAPFEHFNSIHQATSFLHKIGYKGFRSGKKPLLIKSN